MTDDETLSDYQTAKTEESADESPERELAASATATDTDSASSSNTDSASSSGSETRHSSLATYAWSPPADAAVCGECGEASARRWRDGGTFVCPACKTW
ncbi:DUF7573 domain-containing protein [Natrialba asiatica]|uniref:DUF7573 domain-containing protein n=1 Tax=Natrialba asiatica (strain ATCC 700177 / DSM 12278 / JCM 9576 / FERM P-10747 / NBRC 102637 / 172P1) TaxID=29540 RepID=M0B3M0_NATA1|nr:hypothetical protein [Natrialba asiatica]ELZ04838.1 hypothetical protein C481_03627 [Natrialba asiatica DSM 12278]